MFSFIVRRIKLHRRAFNLHKGTLNLHRAMSKLHRWTLNLHRAMSKLHRWTLNLHRAMSKLHRCTLNLHRAMSKLHRWTFDSFYAAMPHTIEDVKNTKIEPPNRPINILNISNPLNVSLDGENQ